MFASLRAFSVPAAVLLAVLGSAQTATRTDTYSYSYFDQQIPLTLDTGRVAVFQREGSLETIRNVVGQPAALEAMEAWTVPGWFMADVAPAARSDAGIQQLVIELVQTDGVDFVSPVFLDPRGELVLMQAEILAGLDPRISNARLRRAVGNNGVVLERDAYGLAGTFRLDSGSRNGFEVLAAANALAEHPDVSYAEPDMIMTAIHGHIPNDPSFGNQWGLNNTGQFGGVPDMDMDAPEAWDISFGNSNVLVAVLDDGVQLNHPDLSLATGVTFTGTSSNGNPGNACDRHGTTVAGTISETIDNGLGGTGVAPGCRAIGLKFTIANVPCNGSGSFALSWLTSALDYCEQNGIRVTNNSNGLGASSTITNKYNSTHANGVVHFSSTGNGGAGFIGYPASLGSVNGVGALTPTGARASFSQFGTGIAFSAPGQTILTTDRTGSAGYVSGDYAFVNGTSYSSPYASGVAGLVLSVDGSLTADQVEQIMNGSCVDLGAAGYDTVFGWGFINAHQAMLDAGGGSDPLAITSISPSTVDVLVPGTNQFLNINGTGFTGNIAVFYDGSPVDPGSFTVVSENLITVDLPQAPIGTRAVLVENDTEVDSSNIDVVASAGLQHQAGNGDDCNPVSVAVGAPLLTFVSSAPVGWNVFTYYSFSDIPSVHPVVTLCMGNNFSQINLLYSGVIPAGGTIQAQFNIAGAATGIKIYTQSLVVDQGTPWPVSNCQSIETAP